MAGPVHGGFEVKAGQRGPNGYQQITDVSAAVGLTAPAGSALAMIQVQDQAVRYRDDGVDPSATVGVVIAAGDTLVYTGNMSTIKFFEKDAGAELNIAYYK